MFDISKFLCILMALLTNSIHVHSTVVDMGTCGCVCGESNTDNEPVITRDGATSNFYNRIRGPQGNNGNPGKRGPVGSRGEPGIKGMKGGAGSHYTPSRSCFDLRQSGEATSGIYSIKPTATSSTIEVFCDMMNDGGGWTLVASVHEDDMKGKCTLGDKWSSERGRASFHSKGSMNWENYNTFGTAEGATSNDYKSPAYFNVPASDVMIWHVPNNVKITQASSRATLKYYTDNRFLKNYGGTLQSLFSEYYPMENAQARGVTGEDITNLALQFNRTTYALRSRVSQFYRYTYDFSGTQNHITDGGNDMFDNGNQVYYQIGDGPEICMTYNVLYSSETLRDDVKILASTSHPFNVIMWIGNALRNVSSFGIKVVTGTGADGGGSTAQFSGTIQSGTSRLQYHSYNVYGADDPSVTEVFYYISNEDWDSVPPTAFLKTPWSSGDDSLQHGVKLTGRPRFVMAGYMLLSKTSDALVSNSEVQSVLTKTMEVLSGLQVGEADCSGGDASLVQPIHYLKGNNETVLWGIPPKVKPQSTPGFIQFRAYSMIGTPHSICPGVKTGTCRPQSICLGGMNSAQAEESACGDFAGWDGLPEDTPTARQPDGFARSLEDQQSSILIFTRDKN